MYRRFILSLGAVLGLMSMVLGQTGSTPGGSNSEAPSVAPQSNVPPLPMPSAANSQSQESQTQQGATNQAPSSPENTDPQPTPNSTTTGSVQAGNQTEKTGVPNANANAQVNAQGTLQQGNAQTTPNPNVNVNGQVDVRTQQNQQSLTQQQNLNVQNQSTIGVDTTRVQGGVNSTVVNGPNTGTGVVTAPADNKWRFKFHNNHWWYWQPSGSWVIYHNNGWIPYDQTTYYTYFPQHTHSHTYAYQPYNNGYYGDGYYYNNNGYYNNRYYNGYYNNGPYSTYYRGQNFGYNNFNASPSTQTGAAIGGAIGGNQGANIGAAIGNSIDGGRGGVGVRGGGGGRRGR